MKVRFSLRAASDLRKIIDLLDTQNPHAAKRLRSAIDTALTVATKFPEIGVPQQHGIRKYILPRFPYLIYYSVAEREQEVRVITIRHAARRPRFTR